MFSGHMKQLKSARRFQGAEKVTIACFLKGEQDKSGFYVGYTGIDSPADATVVSLAVPIASSFPSLKEIRMGYYKTKRGKGFAFRTGGSLNSSRSLIQSLNLSFCGAYESGLIPPNTKVDSFFATCGESYTEHGCEYCARRVACFPPKELAFSSTGRFTCIRTKNFLATIAQRDGGKEVLESKEFLSSLIKDVVRCRNFVDIVGEFGLVPATISSDEARQLIPGLEKVILHISRAKGLDHAEKLKEGHIKALRSLGVPI